MTKRRRDAVTRSPNSDRRSGDRLWDDQGREWQRLRTGTYYLSAGGLQEALATDPTPRVALQADHSPLQGPAASRAMAILDGSDTTFPGNGNSWAVTAWAPITGAGAKLLLVEEVH